MTTPRFLQARIASAGLDLLHMTRLKVACSLLMAERVSADLLTWPDSDVRLLIANVDDAHGHAAAAEGRDAGIAVVRIARQLDDDRDGLRHGATVKELFERLRDTLLDVAPVTDAVAAVAPAPVAAPVEATLFDHLAARDASMLLERDGVRVAIDPRAGLLYPPTTDDAPSVLARAGAQPGWQPVAMLSGTFDPAALGLGAGVPLDAFVWRAAIASGPALTRVPAAQRLALRAWPDVDVATLPLPWLLPIACLLQHSWTRQSLARATGLGLEDATRILAAAKCSGLAVIDTRPVAPVAVPRPAEIAAAPARGFLARVARRFGMQFGGSRG